MQGIWRRDIAAPPPRQNMLLLCLIALLALTILGPAMTYSELPMTGEGSPVRQSSYLLIFLFTVAGTRPLLDYRRLLVVPLPLVLALLWCWLSLTWAIEPEIAIRRLVLTTLVIWTIFTLVRHLGYDKSILLLRWALVLTLIACYIAVLAMPMVGIHQTNDPGDPQLIGNWRGILVQKNFAGAVCALTILPFLFDAGRIPKAIRAVVVILAFFFLVHTQSKTSFGILFVAIFTGFFYTRFSARRRVYAIPLLFVAAVIASLMIDMYSDVLVNKFSDPYAFTGRGMIWQMLWSFADDNPIFGAGYGSFWNIGGSSPVFRYGRGWITEISSGHNGYLDMLTQVGLPGLALIVTAVVIWPLYQLIVTRVLPPARGGLLMAMVMFCTAHNMTESSVFDRDAIVEVCLMISLAMIVPASDVAPRRDNRGDGMRGNMAMATRRKRAPA